MIAVVLISVLGGRKGLQGPAKYLGTWTCTSVTVFGMETDTAGVLDGDFTLELLDTGRYRMEYDGSRKNSFWEADESRITIKDGADEWNGTWQTDGTIDFEDLFGMGVAMTFTKADGGAAVSDDPALGTWICSEYVCQGQQPGSAAALFRKGCTVTLSGNKTGIITADDYTEEVRWSRNGDAIGIDGSYIFKSGFTLENGTLWGEYAESGVTLYFVKVGALLPSATAAAAEDYSGHWNGVDMILAGMSMGELYGDAPGSVLYLDLNADGTGRLAVVDSVSDVSPKEAEGGIAITTPDGDLSFTCADGQLSFALDTAEGRIGYVFERGEALPAPGTVGEGISQAMLDKYNGDWYGYTCFSGGTGDLVKFDGEICSTYLRVVMEQDGTGVFFAVPYIEDLTDLYQLTPVITDGVMYLNGHFWDEPVSGWMFNEAAGGLFVCRSEYEYNGDSSHIELLVRRWGEYWPDSDGGIRADDDEVDWYTEYDAEGLVEAFGGNPGIIPPLNEPGVATEPQPLTGDGSFDSVEYYEYSMKMFGSDLLPKLCLCVPSEGWTLETNTDGVIAGQVYIYNVPKGEYTLSNSPVITVKFATDVSRCDEYRAGFENLKDGEGRTIGGYAFMCRTYVNAGMDWTEYYAQVTGEYAISIKISRIDLSAGSEGDYILNMMSFAD